LDVLGAAVTAILTVVDFVDNIPDTISVAGYAISAPSDPSSDNVSMEETDIEPEVSLSFSDMSPGGHWSYSYVTTLVSRGVISGYADGTFRPNNDITRAEVLKIAMEAAGFSNPSGSSPRVSTGVRACSGIFLV